MNNHSKKTLSIPHDPSKSPSLSKSLCHFVFNEKLGEGTFGTVHLATNTQTSEKVAIKKLDKSKIHHKEQKKRIPREIAILKTIKHTNIVHLYSVIENSHAIYLIMEYIKGKELFDYISEKKKLTELEACKLFQQIISGIEYLHKLNIVHRDIKPENMLLNIKTKELKIIDLGLSNWFNSNKQHLLKSPCGSPSYAPPEMLGGREYKAEPVDIWSSGIVLYAMICGYLPFDDNDDTVLYRKIRLGKFSFPDYISDKGKDLISKMLTTDPRKRISIKQIKKHPWFNLVNGNLSLNEGLIIGQVVIPIDEGIVCEMVDKLNIGSAEEIRSCILGNKHNDISTIYYLLIGKKVRTGKPSVSDFKSVLFLKYIRDKSNLIEKYDGDINKVIESRKRGTRLEKEKKDNKNKNVELVGQKEDVDKEKLSNEEGKKDNIDLIINEILMKGEFENNNINIEDSAIIIKEEVKKNNIEMGNNDVKIKEEKKIEKKKIDNINLIDNITIKKKGKERDNANMVDNENSIGEETNKDIKTNNINNTDIIVKEEEKKDNIDIIVNSTILNEDKKENTNLNNIVNATKIIEDVKKDNIDNTVSIVNSTSINDKEKKDNIDNTSNIVIANQNDEVNKEKLSNTEIINNATPISEKTEKDNKDAIVNIIPISEVVNIDNSENIANSTLIKDEIIKDNKDHKDNINKINPIVYLTSNIKEIPNDNKDNLAKSFPLNNKTDLVNIDKITNITNMTPLNNKIKADNLNIRITPINTFTKNPISTNKPHKLSIITDKRKNSSLEKKDRRNSSQSKIKNQKRTLSTGAKIVPQVKILNNRIVISPLISKPKINDIYSPKGEKEEINREKIKIYSHMRTKTNPYIPQVKNIHYFMENKEKLTPYDLGCIFYIPKKEVKDKITSKLNNRKINFRYAKRFIIDYRKDKVQIEINIEGIEENQNVSILKFKRLLGEINSYFKLTRSIISMIE